MKPDGLRETKKRETRQRLSDEATKLFYARGFDAVTIDEIATAAKVSKVTVFNYFARKEDLFFDREDEVMPLLREALGGKRRGESPVDALRRLVDRLIEEKHPFVRVDDGIFDWWKVVLASPSLEARLRAFGDEVVAGLAKELAGAKKPDADARLVAAMIVVTWRTAYGEALRVFERKGSAKKATAAFVEVINRGFAAVRGMERAT